MFHFDSFLIFLALGFLISLLTKTVFYRMKKWAKHVQAMRKAAGGSLMVDAEAAFWLEKIKRPDYRAIWRWHYAKEWDETPQDIKEPKKFFTRRKKFGVGLIAIATIVIAVLVVLPGIGFSFDVKVPVKTETTVFAYSDNLVFSSVYKHIYFFSLKNTSGYGSETRYPGGVVTLMFMVNRTDSAYATASVLLNLTSGTAYDNGTFYPYISSVLWTFEDPDTKLVSQQEIASSAGFYGLPLNIRGRATMLVRTDIYLNSFPVSAQETFITFKTDSAVDGSGWYVYGGSIPGGYRF